MNNTYNRLQYLHKPQNARGWGRVTFWHASVLLMSRRERAEASDRTPCKLESRKSPKYPAGIPWKASLMESGFPHSIRGWVPRACGESEGAGWPGQSTPCWYKTIRAPFQGGETGESGIKIKQDKDKSGKKKKIQGGKGEGEIGEQNGKSDKGSQHVYFLTLCEKSRRGKWWS